jgi:hypothetical protein
MVEKHERHSSDTILFLAATTSFSAYQDSANEHFHKENEKILTENDAASQAASAHPMKRYVSGNDLFPLFALWIVTRKTGNTGEEKLCVTSTLPRIAVNPLPRLAQSKPGKRIESEKRRELIQTTHIVRSSDVR